MKKYLVYLYIVLVGIVFYACATFGSPSGGKSDIDPPRILKFSVAPNTTNFKATKIEITFDEFITLKDLRKQLVISPPMEKFPDIKPIYSPSKKLVIDFKDQVLRPNTTYIFNFGKSLVDNNEANILYDFQFVFSTGDYIDSLYIGGMVIDALTNKAVADVAVMLYDIDRIDTLQVKEADSLRTDIIPYSDSAAYKRKPDYITRISDKADSTFLITNVRPGRYKLIALEDLNGNSFFNSDKERIAFSSDTIILPQETPRGYILRLSLENTAYKALRPSNKMPGLIQIPFAGAGHAQVEPERIYPNWSANDTLVEHFLFNEKRDTLNYWYNVANTDSLSFVIRHEAQSDTLGTKIRKTKNSKFHTAFKGINIELHDSIKLTANKPIAQINDSLIYVFDKDSTRLKIKPTIDSSLMGVNFGFPALQQQEYKVLVMPGALQSMFGEPSKDTLSNLFKIKKIEDYGNLIIKLPDVKTYPIIVQLTDSQGNVLREEFLNEYRELSFPLLNPSLYGLRIIYDTNGNGIWDPVSLLEGRQPEYIREYPEKIEIKAFWDVEEVWEFRPAPKTVPDMKGGKRGLPPNARNRGAAGQNAQETR